MISLTYIGLIDLCVLCVSVVRPTPSPARLYLRIHFTHQTGESPENLLSVGSTASATRGNFSNLSMEGTFRSRL
ncbi:MAG: hypothetical protein EWV41_20220 [Microcystis wesenbergii Mw_MB_S_20031200_S109]|uniref:Uncharacterized protein n=1 Tax=Microcystis wesenbergii Mw_MB_S_20031200_S109D TaxID=2486241 RepID=A0A552LNN5_9CHRO|nr:MAG: hypothetical protein EWV41_20220 [Microcystis wesenbergii Mw_MB_S_20031200_S109]TRV21827.1 MAG: hypothetical protein EWV88_14330 [Microcystis wesenbergii Mw_MB_S_20031200_S109D]